MDNRASLSLRQSIRTRLLVLLLGLTIVSVGTIAYLGVNSILRAGQIAEQASSAALRVQAEEYLRQLTVGDAQRNALTLKRVEHEVENLAQYTASILEKRDVLAGGAYWQVQDHMFMGQEGQYINGQDDITSVHVPNFVNIDDELLIVLELSSYLDFIFPACEDNPDTIAVYLGTEQGITRYYPNVNLGAVLPPDFRVTQRPWYVISTPENNPERKAVWSSVYEDATGQGLLVTAAAPVYVHRDEFVGVVGIDLVLRDIAASVEANRLLGGGYSFLVDDTGRAIALPEQGYRDILNRSPEAGEFGADLSAVTTGFAPVLVEMMAGATGFQSVAESEKELFVAYAPLEGTGWSLANVVEAGNILQAVTALQEELEASTHALVLRRILPVGAIILLVAVLVGLLLTRRLVAPLQELAMAAQRIGGGEWDTLLPQAGDDEIGVLTRAFRAMVAHIRELVEGLEARVAERTRELESTAGDLSDRSEALEDTLVKLQKREMELKEAVRLQEKARRRQEEINRELQAANEAVRRRSAQLQATAEVSQAIAQVRDPDELLSQVTQFISRHFGFYHVGIFIIDEAGRDAVLWAANSDGGQRMLARKHRLRVGEQGIVGYVTGSGRPRIALDVGTDAVFFDNPDLSRTRSEMALPLRRGAEIIGALDVQSTEPGAFDDQDVAVLQMLADQVSIALENARLFAQARAALDEAEAAHRQYLRQEWRRYAQRATDLSHEYLLAGRENLAGRPLPAGDAAFANASTVILSPEAGDRGSALAVPVKLRDQVIGVLDLEETDENRQWSEEEIALAESVAEQLALTLESTRLFEQTQARAEEQTVLAEMGRVLTTMLDAEAVIESIYRHTSRLMDTTNLYIALYHPEQDQVSFALYVEGESTRWWVGRRQMGKGLTEHVIHTREPLLIPENVVQWLEEQGVEAIGQVAQSWLGVPMLIGERTIGVIALQSYTTPRLFNEHHRDLLSAIANQAAIAIQNANLFEQAQARARRERLIREITDKIRGKTDLDAILQTTVTELGKALATSRAAIRLGTENELTSAAHKSWASGQDGEQ